MLLPQFTATLPISTRSALYRVDMLTSVPTMIAMMLRERELLARTDLIIAFAWSGWARRRFTQSLIEQVRAFFRTHRSPTATAPPRLVPSYSVRILAEYRSRSCRSAMPHRAVQLRLVARRRRASMKACSQMRMPGADERLPQSAGGDRSGDDLGRLVRHRRRVPPRRRRLLSSSSGAPTTCSSAAARMCIPAKSSGCWSAPKHPPGRRRSGSGRDQGPEARRVRRARNGADLDEDDVKTYALANAPAYQHPRRIIFSTRCRLPAPTRSTSAPLRSAFQPSSSR